MTEEKNSSLSTLLEIVLEGKGDVGELIETILREKAIRSVAFFSEIRKDLGDLDDFKQEFRIAALEALKEVNPSIGDPIYFVYNRAINRLKNFINQKQNKKFDTLSDWDMGYSLDQEVEVMVDIHAKIDTLSGRQRQIAELSPRCKQLSFSEMKVLNLKQ